MIGKVEKTIEAQNVYTDTIEIQDYFNVSISGMVQADIVTLERSFDNGTLWKDVESYIADEEDTLYETEKGVIYRLGVKTGDYVGGGTILARISF